MSERIKIKYPIIVEGRYDKSTLLSIFDTAVITTGGFAVFNSSEKQQLIRRLAERGGIILLTDSDGGGRQIRSFISGMIPKGSLYHLYIPEIEGKEKRKARAGKAGLLGVEGMERDLLVKLLSPFISDGTCQKSVGERQVTVLDLYNDGLSGGEGSSEKRNGLAAALGLPHGMTAKALLEAVNLICGYEEYKSTLQGLLEKGF